MTHCQSIMMAFALVSPCAAVEWTLINHAQTHQDAKAHVVLTPHELPLSAELDEPPEEEADTASAVGVNAAGLGQASVATTIVEVPGGTDTITWMIGGHLMANITADVELPEATATLSAYIDRRDMLQANEAGVMRGSLDISSFAGSVGANNLETLRIRVGIGKSHYTAAYSGTHDVWWIEELTTCTVVDGENVVIDWVQEIEGPLIVGNWGDMDASPWQISQFVAKDELVPVDVTLLVNQFRLEVSTEWDDDIFQKIDARLQGAARLISE